MTDREVLDGGCVLYRIPLRGADKPRQRGRWNRRPMLHEEYNLALEFGKYPFRGCPHTKELAEGLYQLALRDWEITEKQSRAIYAIAERYGIIPGGRTA
jgi:hypothetical protein